MYLFAVDKNRVSLRESMRSPAAEYVDFALLHAEKFAVKMPVRQIMRIAVFAYPHAVRQGEVPVFPFGYHHISLCFIIKSNNSFVNQFMSTNVRFPTKDCLISGALCGIIIMIKGERGTLPPEVFLCDKIVLPHSPYMIGQRGGVCRLFVIVGREGERIGEAGDYEF